VKCMPNEQALNLVEPGLPQPALLSIAQGCLSQHCRLMQSWSPELQQYMDSLKGADNPAGKPYTSRYIGSLVRALNPEL